MGRRLRKSPVTAKWPPDQERRPAPSDDIEKRTKEVADGEQ
ncbi:MAG: hypothetical protein RL347_1446 [Actinomycetota bacterium]|jgi:hypothetical protein